MRFLILLMALCLNSLLHASTTLSPVRIISNGNNTEIHEFSIFNRGEKTIRLDLSVNNDDYFGDITQYIDLAPKRIRLMPNVKQKIKVRVRKIPDKYPEKVYRAFIKISESQVEESLSNNKGGIAINLSIDRMMPLYVKKGNINPNISINCEELEIYNNSSEIFIGKYMENNRLVDLILRPKATKKINPKGKINVLYVMQDNKELNNCSFDHHKN